MAVLFSGAAGTYSARGSSTFVRIAPVAVTDQHGVAGRDAVADDPNLANRIIHTLMVSVPAGFDWTNSEIRIQLSTGTIYNAVSNPDVDAEGDPTPALWTAPGSRQGAYDTFVNAKPGTNGRVRSATLLGTLNADGSAGSLPAIGLSGSNSTVASVAWGNTVGGEDGVFQIAQFTTSADATGTYFGHTYSTDQPGGAFHTFQGLVGVIIPEPCGLAGLLLCGVGLLRRRRTAEPRGLRERLSADPAFPSLIC
jgi:hypothetical protein